MVGRANNKQICGNGLVIKKDDCNLLQLRYTPFFHTQEIANCKIIENEGNGKTAVAAVVVSIVVVCDGGSGACSNGNDNTETKKREK